MEKYDKEYIQVSMPLALEGICFILLTTIELIMVGKLGTNAIAAVSIFVQPKMILLCIIRAFATSVTILIAQKIGMGKQKEIKVILQQSLAVAMIGMGILHLLFYQWLEPILRFAGAKNNYLADALNYGTIMIFSVFLTSLTTVLQAGFMGIGETKTVMKINLMGNFVSVICNSLFIFGVGPIPRLGIKGAAFGSCIGAICALGKTLSMLRKQTLWEAEQKLSFIPIKIYLKEVGSVFYGILLEQGSERVGMVLYSRMAANLGTIPFAVHSVCMNVCDIYYNFAQGMGKASMIMIGQAKGKQDEVLHRSYIKTSQKISLLCSSLACLICILFRQAILESYFVEQEAVQLGSMIMLFVGFVSFPEAQAMVYAGALRGCGRTMPVAIYSFISITVIRPIVTAVLIYQFDFGLYGAWIPLVLDQTLRAICATVLVKKEKINCNFLERK